MSKAKHSPGPWTVAVGRDGTFVVQAEEHGQVICRLSMLHETPWNAKVLAEATEMLALLREARDALADELDPLYASDVSLMTRLDAMLKRLEG